MPDRSIAGAIEAATDVAIVDHQGPLETLVRGTRTMADETNNADMIR
jgi:hypothetical protein